ncbi:MAG: HNH endonuclease [Actinomycetales bacterium]|nr:MAG: HNH endonuclease [Actinomycetales bacterium]
MEEYPIKMPNWKIIDDEINPQSTWERFIQSSGSRNLERTGPADCKALVEATRNRLTIFTLIHDPRIDEPVATIFDTLNGMRTELEPLDHVRNSIFIRLTSDNASSLFKGFWQPAEDQIRDVRIKGLKPGISFLYDFIISEGEKKRQGTISRLKGASHLARMTRDFDEEKLIDFMQKKLIPAMICWPVVIRKRNSVKFDGIEIHFSEKSLELMDSIRDLTKNPANPLVLLYASARVKGEITDKQLERSLGRIEVYLARLVLALTPLSPLRARIMDIAGDIDGNTDELVLKAALKTAQLPTDAMIRKISKKGQYGELDPSQLGAIFRGIEKSMSGKNAMNFKIGPSSYTVEHIYPQKDIKWHNDLKIWKMTSKKMDGLLQTIGNLTVVSKEHNSRVGNSRLKDKQIFPTVPGRAAPLGIHKGWVNAPMWTEHEILARTTDLINHALRHWKVLK